MDIIKNMHKTGKALQYFLDYPEKFEGGEAYLEQYVQDCHVIPVCELLCYVPSDIDYYADGFDFDPESIDFTYHTGYWWSTEQGDIKTINPEQCNQLVIPIKARFLCTYPLGEEIEMQADNGELAYYYIGPNFLAVWDVIEEEV